MNRTLVTGASGFIGSALTKKLSSVGYDVIAWNRRDGDVTLAESWLRMPSVDHVVHAAGRTYVPDSWANPDQFINDAVASTTHALEFSRRNKAHLLFISAYLYGVSNGLPIAEDHPVRPNNPYALSKFLAERICFFYARHFSLPVTIIRPFNIFGHGQRSHFLIPTIVAQLRDGKEIRVKDLTPRRDYLYIEDLLEAMHLSLVAPDGLRLFNVGSGQSYSVQEIIDILQMVSGTSLPVLADGERRTNEIDDVKADIALARKSLGWQPNHTLPEGISKLLKLGDASFKEPGR